MYFIPLIIRRNQTSEFWSKTSKYWLLCTSSLSFETATFKPEEAAHEGSPFSSHDTQAFTQQDFTWLHGRTWEESLVQKSRKWKKETHRFQRTTCISDTEGLKLTYYNAQKTLRRHHLKTKKDARQKNKVDRDNKSQSTRAAMEPVLLCTGNSTLCHLFWFCQNHDKSLIY